MSAERSSRTLPLHWAAFALALALTLGMYTWYGVNLARWTNSPDFGWRTMYDSGPNVVAEVFATGKAAGLRAGDTIVAINGRPYHTFDEFFFGNLRSTEPGSVNRYTVIRDGQRVDVDVSTGRLGLRSVLRRSGPLFLIGLLYVLIGTLVFLMKPRAVESRLFLLMTCFVGMRVSFAAPSELIRPIWFYELRFLNETLLPASMISLALTFPKAHALVRRRPSAAFVPYVASFALFLLLQLTSTVYWDIPRSLFLAAQVYTLLGIVFFLGSMVRNVVRDPSVIVRLQSQVIFAGILLAFLIPTSDLLFRFLWRFYLFPDPALSFAVFLSLFPVSIGYTIVKHDLFAIDVIVRRTYGYVLSSAAIIGSYGLLVTLLNVTFQGAEFAKSPLFSIGFALAVVFVFEPLHRRVQGVVDRVFYRQQYDYRKTIRSLSEAMTSIFDAKVIASTLIGSVVREMFLETGALFLRASSGGYQLNVAEVADTASIRLRDIGPEDALLQALKAKNDVILRHDFALNPIYEAERHILEDQMQALSAELLVPMRYKDELVGILPLGRKKSGKMFTPEDLDLLRTLTNQSAIALENARLFRENLEKGRIEEELRIAHSIQLSMLPEHTPELEGLRIAARSISAREVGGDFYDFVEFNGDGTCSRLGVVVGDVSGKGVSGALLMAASRSTYRVLSEARSSAAEVMGLANERLRRDIKKGMFVALLYAIIDPRQKTLTLSNAGQTQPVMCRIGESSPRYLETEGDTFPLGIVPECDYRETEIALRAGDVVVFYTDGVVEAMNAKSELYGFDRLMGAISSARDLGADELLQSVMDDVTRFVGGVEQHDDLTIVVAKVE